jgi:hypothetical protein
MRRKSAASPEISLPVSEASQNRRAFSMLLRSVASRWIADCHFSEAHAQLEEQVQALEIAGVLAL